MSKMQFHTVESVYGNVHVAIDDISPQEWGTAAAMFSRSKDGIVSIAEKMEGTDKTKSMMERFYVGYGHNSIGDLVDVKLFIEGIPFYVAALFEHHSLFRGQESSTRYIDFSNQNPCCTADEKLYEKQISFYVGALEKVTNNLMNKALELNATHERAIKARAFDICRGLLPLGGTTNIAWYGSIRSIKSHLAWLVKECEYFGLVAPYANLVYSALKEVYPESMEDSVESVRPSNPWVFDNAEVTFSGLLDFGSWRDLNRHRVGLHKFSLPNLTSALHSWYVEHLEYHGINLYSMETPRSIDSCYLGQVSQVEYSCPMSQAEYFVKLRSKPSVHPTLRNFVGLNVAKENLAITCDETPDAGYEGYFIQRGNETITIKA